VAPSNDHCSLPVVASIPYSVWPMPPTTIVPLSSTGSVRKPALTLNSQISFSVSA